MGASESTAEKKTPTAIVLLHVYDLDEKVTMLNDGLYKLGAGAYHAGVEVYGREYSFDGNGGIWWTATPKQHGDIGYVHRESIVLGRTTLSHAEVMAGISRSRSVWTAARYDLLRCNCCHFASDFATSLGVGPIP